MNDESATVSRLPAKKPRIAVWASIELSPVWHKSSRRLSRAGQNRKASSSGSFQLRRSGVLFFASYPQRRFDGNFVLRIRFTPDRRDEYTGRKSATLSHHGRRVHIAEQVGDCVSTGM